MFVFTDREPLGVVAAVIPWNSQMFLSSGKDRACASGWKHHRAQSQRGGFHPLLAFGKLVTEADVPDGVVNIVTGHGGPAAAP